MPTAQVLAPSSLTGLIAIVTRCDVDQLAFLERQVVQKAR
jgi:hypothetical protein